jgi:hypothetical protein
VPSLASAIESIKYSTKFSPQTVDPTSKRAVAQTRDDTTFDIVIFDGTLCPDVVSLSTFVDEIRSLGFAGFIIRISTNVPAVPAEEELPTAITGISATLPRVVSTGTLAALLSLSEDVAMQSDVEQLIVLATEKENEALTTAISTYFPF